MRERNGMAVGSHDVLQVGTFRRDVHRRAARPGAGAGIVSVRMRRRTAPEPTPEIDRSHWQPPHSPVATLRRAAGSGLGRLRSPALRDNRVTQTFATAGSAMPELGSTRRARTRASGRRRGRRRGPSEAVETPRDDSTEPGSTTGPDGYRDSSAPSRRIIRAMSAIGVNLLRCARRWSASLPRACARHRGGLKSSQRDGAGDAAAAQCFDWDTD
jgi:hypothetical protein